MPLPDPVRIDRRLAIKWILTAGAGAVVFKGRSLGADAAAVPAPQPGMGYGTDPDLVKKYTPGDYWPLTFTVAERRVAGALCDVVIPADERSPSASAVGVTDFIDEWVSAPYPGCPQDRAAIVAGLGWLDGASVKRHGAAFADAAPEEREALCAEMAAASPGNAASGFFRRFRDLVAIGYYTTPEGMKAIGYVGNVPLARFEGPPAYLVARLGLSDEVAW